MEEKNTHYRKVFKSDHLGSADLEEMIEDGKSLILTIVHVKQEIQTKVAGKKGDFNIAYFKEIGIKPLVLNSTNCKTLKKLSGSPFVNKWTNLRIELFIDKSVKMKGEVVGGVRIKPQLPGKPELSPTATGWDGAITALKAGTVTMNQIKGKYSITKENEELLCKNLK